MPDNRKNHSNVATILPNNGTVDKIQEGISRMKMEKNEKERIEYPDRPGEPDCLYYLRIGLYGYGTNCRFNHPPILPSKTAHSAQDTRSELPQREGQPDCGGEDLCVHLSSHGGCKYGATSYYLGMPSMPMLDLPLLNSTRNSTEASQSKSSKMTDWIQKPDIIQDKKLKSSVSIKSVDPPQQEPRGP